MKKKNVILAKVFLIIGIIYIFLHVFYKEKKGLKMFVGTTDNTIIECLEEVGFGFDISLIEIPMDDSTYRTDILGLFPDSILYCVYEKTEGKEDTGNHLIYGQYYKHFVETGQNQLIAKSSGCFTLIGNFIYEEGIIYGEVTQEETLNISIYYQANLDERIELYTFETLSIPDLYFEGDTLFISYETFNNTHIQQLIEAVSIETGRVKRLVNEEYSISDDNLCTGKMILGLSGNESGILYQSVTFDNENPDLDYTGRPQIVYLNLLDNNQTILIKLEKKASFLGGNPEILVITDYAYERPLENTGKIYLKNKNEEYISYLIPEIESVNDIKTSEIINERFVIIQSFQAVYIIDIDTLSYEKHENMKFVFSGKNSIYCMENNKNLLLKISLEM